MLRAIGQWLGLKQGELGKTLGMFLYLMMVVGAFITGRIIRDTLFLSRGDIQYLPYMYVWVAVVMAALGATYSQFADRFRRDRLILAVTSLLLVAILVSRYVLRFEPGWFYPVFYVFVEVMGGLMMLQFWTLANDVFNTREAKRLFGLIGAGGIVSSIVVGFAVGWLAKALGTANLLFLCAGLLCGCIAIVLILSRVCRAQLDQAMIGGGKPGRAPAGKGGDWAQILSSSHLQSIAWITILAFLAITVVDYQFKVMSRVAYLNREDELSGFFGMFYGISGFMGLLIQLFFTGRVIQRFGIVAVLLVLPFFMGTGSVFLVLSQAFLPVALLKGCDTVLRYSLHDATMQLLYLPLAVQIRGRAKTFVEGILKPASQGLAGLIIGWTAAWTAQRVNWLSLGTIAAAIGWGLLVLGVKREYLVSLMSTLRHKKLTFDDSELSLPDTRDLEILRQALSEKDEESVRNALQLIPHSKSQGWIADLGPLLSHDSHRVRVLALRLLDSPSCIGNIWRILAMTRDPDPAIRKESILCYAHTMKEKSAPALEGFLGDADVWVRAAAISSLMSYGGLDGIIAAAQPLKTLLGSAKAEDRRAAVWAIGQVGVHTFYRSVLPLLQDPDLTVRLEAFRTAERIQSRELVLPLIYALADPRTNQAATRALAAHGPAIIPMLKTVLDGPQEDVAVLQAIPRVLGRIPDQRSVDLLCRLLDSERDGPRSQAIYAVQSLCLRHPELGFDHQILERALLQELRQAYQSRVILVELGALFATLLVDDLLHRYQQGLDRIFRILRMLYPRNPLEDIQRNLTSANPLIRANSLELLDNLVEPGLRDLLIPLLEEKDPLRLIARGNEFFPLMHLDPRGWLNFLLRNDDEWTVVCVLEALTRVADETLVVSVRMILGHCSALVRETALSTLCRMLPAMDFLQNVSELKNDPNERVCAMYAYLFAEATRRMPADSPEAQLAALLESGGERLTATRVLS